ncbi:MAG: prolyl oligopeptidase family serine peptidase [Acetobacter peroxydans]|nr:prolyl oligopeptidase family serine peptidase [Acetobacter peroxydans]MCI2078276.1 prolyl oligopeptidase family serine peptidase [Acetobacter peroxydans]
MIDRPSLPSESRRPISCGAWPSPVTAALVAGKTLTLSEVTAWGQTVYWLERRPAEGGRTALMSWSETAGIAEVLPPQTDIGTRVHEYGGGAYAVGAQGIAYSDRKSGAVWLTSHTAAAADAGKGKEARQIAGEAGLRFADLRFDSMGGGLLAVREDYRHDHAEPQAALVVLNHAALSEPAGQEAAGGVVLASGADFYAAPAVSPDGSLLAWVEWSHPFMPWEATRLCVARLERAASGAIMGLGAPCVLAGAGGQESLLEPRWTEDGRLLVISDRSGQWSVWQAGRGEAGAVLKPCAVPQGEIGQPAWVFGQRSYQPLPGGACLFLSVREGESQTVLRRADGTFLPVPGRPEQCPVPLVDGRLVWLDAPPDALPRIMVADMAAAAPQERILYHAAPAVLQAQDIASPVSLRFRVGDEETPSGHAFFYPPTSSTACVPEGERPPLIVQVHGGPTARAQDSFSFKVQWWTSRGFAVLDVNYGGSSGFGRAWRERLRGQWGVVDVADCIAACAHVVCEGWVDPRRIAIRGSSAGGMTVLVALAESSLFAAGVSLYGVTDLRALAVETHKFESRYLDGLIGPWPESEALYLARSPLQKAVRIRAPVLLFQGQEDRVVPLSQARAMAEALREAGTPCTLREFPGEGHGFRQESTIRTAFVEELAFYGRLFGFEPAESGA